MTKNHPTASSSVWSNTSNLRDALKNQSSPSVPPTSTRPIVVTVAPMEQQHENERGYEKWQLGAKTTDTAREDDGDDDGDDGDDGVESSLVRHTEQSLSLNTHQSAAAAAAGGEDDSTQLSFEKRRVLVLDTSSLLRWSDIRLEQLGTVFYTTPGIIEEIRDSQSRAALNTIPLQLRIRAPLPDSLLQVKKYALKTGDYSALSANDMAILGLSYELEMELNGKNNCLKPVPEDVCRHHHHLFHFHQQ